MNFLFYFYIITSKINIKSELKSSQFVTFGHNPPRKFCMSLIQSNLAVKIVLGSKNFKRKINHIYKSLCRQKMKSDLKPLVNESLGLIHVDFYGICRIMHRIKYRKPLNG